MAQEYALQHKTSRRYVAADPELGVHVETPDAAAAFTWSTITGADVAHCGMGDFVGAWESVVVSRPSTLYPVEREGPRA